MKIAKTLTLFLVTTLCVLTLISCADNRSQLRQEAENVLGNLEELPIELASVKERLGEDLICGKLESDDEEESYEIAIGMGVAVVDYTLRSEIEMLNGETYPMMVRALFVGTAVTSIGNEFLLNFIGGNFELTLEAENVQNVTEQFVADLEETFSGDEFDIELTETDKAVYLSFARGKKVWASVQSFLWESVVDLKAKTILTYDESGGIFRMENNDGNTQKCDRTYYPDGKLESETYYDYDKKNISEKRNYAYPENGGTEVSYVYYYSDNQNVMEEGYAYYLGAENKSERPMKGWKKYYDVNGCLLIDALIQEDGTDISTYYVDGIIRSKSMCRYRSDSNESEKVWEEEYENGVRVSYMEWLDENTMVFENYYGDGTIYFRRKIEGDYVTYESFDENGVLNFYDYSYEKSILSEEEEYVSYTLLRKVIKDDSTVVSEYTYDEYWNCESLLVTTYDKNGVVIERWLFENDRLTEKWAKGYTDSQTGVYYADGYEFIIYHPNGNEKIIEYGYTEEQMAYYAELDEDFVTLLSRQYNEDGVLIETQEMLENGDFKWISIYPNPENENDCVYNESVFDKNGDSKSQIIRYANGDYFYWADNKDGTIYSVRYNADGSVSESFCDENLDLTCWRTYIAEELYSEIYFQGNDIIYKYEDGKVVLGEKPSWNPQSKI